MMSPIFAALKGSGMQGKPAMPQQSAYAPAPPEEASPLASGSPIFAALAANQGQPAPRPSPTPVVDPNNPIVKQLAKQFG